MAHILIVDDSVSIRQMVSFTLKSSGHSIVEAADGKDGLAKALATKFDLILTDQNMPNMTGLDFIKAYRAKGNKTPILILTTESGDAMKSQGRAAGATGWLVKPFDPHKLIETVAKVLR